MPERLECEVLQKERYINTLRPRTGQGQRTELNKKNISADSWQPQADNSAVQS